MRELTFKQVVVVFLMLVMLSILQTTLGIDSAVTFVMGILTGAIATFFGVKKLNDKRQEEEIREGNRRDH